MDLTINGTQYTFNAGMGFLRDINKTSTAKSEGITQNVGLRVAIAELLNGDVEALENVLIMANKNCVPRIDEKTLDAYFEDKDTDIDWVFDTVIDFLSKSNATRKAMTLVKEAIAKNQASE